MTDTDFNVQDVVAEFQTKFETSSDQNLWTKLIIEESKEVNEAIENLLKELNDLVYVSSGYMNIGGNPEALMDNPDVSTAIQWTDGFAQLFGQDRLEEAFKRVHASNMSKLGDDGKPVRRADGKVMKGPNYKPPVLTDLITL